MLLTRKRARPTADPPSGSRLLPDRTGMLGPQSLRTLRTLYGMQSDKQYLRCYSANRRLCVDASATEFDYMARLKPLVDDLVLKPGPDRIVASLYNEVYVYSPIAAAKAGNWTLFEEINRVYETEARREYCSFDILTPRSRRDDVSIRKGWPITNYVVVVTPAGRKVPVNLPELEECPYKKKSLNRFLVDSNECPICLEPNCVDITCCEQCVRFICLRCASKTSQQCPFCRHSNPDYFYWLHGRPYRKPSLDQAGELNHREVCYYIKAGNLDRYDYVQEHAVDYDNESCSEDDNTSKSSDPEEMPSDSDEEEDGLDVADDVRHSCRKRQLLLTEFFLPRPADGARQSLLTEFFSSGQL